MRGHNIVSGWQSIQWTKKRYTSKSQVEVERVMAIGASLGGEIQIQDADIILYPLIGREVINKDISPTRLASKQSKNTFEIMVEKERHSQQTLFENFHLIDE